mmetsp:Transcript_19704/g.33821  ORF Transcript_19704/g.33821 Transcript_19704/m.33821 type:complete len:365 (+) Transcript_19704:36-1130(+)|eukprot:CAMPEP_0196656092 /NCGR_PEP_ID=MMETSP1086-20130531/13331_1 /TAXON_ID=77921 /ORGANISM="Cyanoptyche  gloeocystis , Strain SAG4.97" /LENGTH=364 /DNA_ID=CAMNT_0041988705 /DNA_START=36 /DNA_END=1130 /DNA_ORIENTATION=+
MVWPKTALSTHLGVKYPVIQAPMGGGMVTPELVAAVSNKGALGSFAAYGLAPEEIREKIKAIKSLTSNPFSVNVRVPDPDVEHLNFDNVEKVNAALNKIRADLGLPDAPPPTPTKPSYTLADQVDVILEEGVPIISFWSDLLPADIIAKIKAKGVVLIGTANTLEEAKTLEKSGIDVIVAQGGEAGGHRGGSPKDAHVTLMTLVPLLRPHITVPIVAAGGIMNGQGILAALTLGADGVQMGTAFLGCPETHVHPKYREALLACQEDSTRLTKSFTGRSARSVLNKFMKDMQPLESLLPPSDYYISLTRPIIRAAHEQGRVDYMPLFAGMGARMIRQLPVSELIDTLVKEVQNSIGKLMVSEMGQ